MSIDYAALAADTLAALQDVQDSKTPKQITRRAYSLGAYDPATGSTGTTTADTTRTGAIFDFGAGQTLERGTLIQHGDKRLLVDASDVVLPSDHFIDADGVEYSIVSIGKIAPGGVACLYDVHLRT